MEKKDELLIQLINEEIQGKGGGFEQFCELLTDEVLAIVKKVFPSNQTQQKKAVKQILVRIYQRIDMADLNNIHEWIEQFAMEVLEKNYPKETAEAKMKQSDEEKDTDELIAAAMAAFEKLQDKQPETSVDILKEAEELKLEVQQDFKEYHTESEDDYEDDHEDDYEGIYEESEDESDEGEYKAPYLSERISRQNIKKLMIAAVPCVIALIAVLVIFAGGQKKQSVSVNSDKATKNTQEAATRHNEAATTAAVQTNSAVKTQTETKTDKQEEDDTVKETQKETQKATKKASQVSGGQSQTAGTNAASRRTQAVNETAGSNEKETSKESETEETQEKTTEKETEEQTEEKTTKEEKTTEFETQAPTTKPSMSAAVRK